MLYRVSPEIAIAKASGHFFKQDTMKFHQTRISDTCYDVNRFTEQFYLLVLSNRYPGEPRHYRIVCIDKTTGRTTYGTDVRYATLRKAKQVAAWWAEPMTPFFTTNKGEQHAGQN